MNDSVIFKKKICMLGGYAVGKTSLVRHFIEGIFSEKYQITIGVKIDKKTIRVNDQQVKLMLWDIAGEEENFTIPVSYLKGTHGFLLVIDGTRIATYDQALDIQNRVVKAAGNIPFVVVINKSDLHDAWEVDNEVIDDMQKKYWAVVKSSAKLGTGVEEAFNILAEKMLS